MHIKKRRFIPVVIALLALIAVSGVAYAYWTAGGSGSGTAAAASSTSNVTVHQTTTLHAMYPGDTAQTISGNFTNTGSGPVYVSSVTASISSVTKAGGAPTGTCGASDFTLNNITATVNAEVPIGNPETTVTWTGPTIQFHDTASNQDACKGATVTIGYSIP
jgi:hypothetical protein